MSVRPRRACLAPELPSSNPFSESASLGMEQREQQQQLGLGNSATMDEPGQSSKRGRQRLPRGRFSTVHVCLPVLQPIKIQAHPRERVREVKRRAWNEFFQQVLLAPDRHRPEPYWHGPLPDEGAHGLLSSVDEEGCFLVRQARQCSLDVIVSVWWRGTSHHLPFTWRCIPSSGLQQPMLQLRRPQDADQPAPQFVSVSHLIAHYRDHPLPLLNGKQRLTRSIERGGEHTKSTAGMTVQADDAASESSGVFADVTASREMNAHGWAWSAVGGLNGHDLYWVAFETDAGAIQPVFNENMTMTEVVESLGARVQSTTNNTDARSGDRGNDDEDHSGSGRGGTEACQLLLHVVPRDTGAALELESSDRDRLTDVAPKHLLPGDDPCLAEQRMRLCSYAKIIQREREEAEYLLSPQLDVESASATKTLRTPHGSQMFTVTAITANGATQAMHVSPDDTAHDVLQRVVHTNRRTLSRHPSSDLAFKVPGTRECLFGHHRMLSFAHVHHALVHDRPIRLEVCSVSSLLEQSVRDTGKADPMASSRLLPFDPPSGRRIEHQPPTPLSQNEHRFDAALISDTPVLSCWTSTHRFTVSQVVLLGEAPPTSSSSAAADTTARVSLSLYCGDACLCREECGGVALQRMGATTLASSVAFQMLVMDLPHASTLHAEVTLCDSDGAIVRTTHARAALFDVHGELLQGAVTLSLYSGSDPVVGHLPPRSQQHEVARVRVLLPSFPYRIAYPRCSFPFRVDAELEAYDRAQCEREDNSFSTTALQYAPAVLEDGVEVEVTALEAVSSSSLSTDVSRHQNPSARTPVSTSSSSRRTLRVAPDLVPVISRLLSAGTGPRLASERWSYRRKRQRVVAGRDLVLWLQRDMDDVPRENAVLLAQRLIRVGAVVPTGSHSDAVDSTKLFALGDFTHIKGDASLVSGDAEEDAVLRAEAQMALANQEIHDGKRLAVIHSSDLIATLTAADKRLLFRRRRECIRFPLLLPKFLRSVDWGQAWQVREAYRLLESWTPTSTATDALQLLHFHFADPHVRSMAVVLLDAISDTELDTYLLQLVQVLRFEQHHDSPLARFLLRRALQNRRIGQSLFWLLRSELETMALATRCAVLLEAYCHGCGAVVLTDIHAQSRLASALYTTAAAVKEARTQEQRDALLRHTVSELQEVLPCALMHDAYTHVLSLQQDACRVLDSKKKPLWLCFNTEDSAAAETAQGPSQQRTVELIFKAGDDLRQDMLTLQMLRVMERLWSSEGLDVRVTAYGCVATSSDSGVIQVVPGARTISSIQRAYGGSLAALSEEPLLSWLREQGGDRPDRVDVLRSNFAKSCAAYCVATYVLGIGDRHNDNIMVTPTGDFFHIDFGHFLGNIKYKFGVKRELAPFVLTSEFIYVMGGRDSDLFHEFEELCVRAYLVLRKHANLIIALFAMMLSTGIPELQSEEDISHLQRTLCLDATREQAAKHFRSLISECIRLNLSTQLNFLVHNLAH